MKNRMDMRTFKRKNHLNLKRRNPLMDYKLDDKNID